MWQAPLSTVLSHWSKANNSLIKWKNWLLGNLQDSPDNVVAWYYLIMVSNIACSKKGKTKDQVQQLFIDASS